MIYLTAEMLGHDCSFELAHRVACGLTDAGYEARAFDTSGSIPAGYESPNVVPDGVFYSVLENSIKGLQVEG